MAIWLYMKPQFWIAFNIYIDLNTPSPPKNLKEVQKDSFFFLSLIYWQGLRLGD